MLKRIGQVPLTTFLILVLGLPFFLAWVSNIVSVFQQFQSSLDIPKADPKRRELLNVLQEIGTLPRKEKRETLLFIPQSNLLYWNWYQYCKATPFIAPAITEMAMLDGVPPASCEATFYGYPSYSLRSPNEPVLQADNISSICKAAQERGFTKVIVVDTNQHQEVHVQSLDCNL